MSTVKKVKLTLKLDNGKTALINLPTPVSMDLDDPETADPIWRDTYDPIVAAYASDDGATIKAIDYHVVETVTTSIADNYQGFQG